MYVPCFWELLCVVGYKVVRVLKVCDVRVGVLPGVMWVQVY